MSTLADVLFLQALDHVSSECQVDGVHRWHLLQSQLLRAALLRVQLRANLLRAQLCADPPGPLLKQVTAEVLLPRRRIVERC